MDIKNLRIIQGLIVTSKSREAFEKEKKVTLKVDPRANKSEIKYAVEAAWGVKVKQVRTISVHGKTKRFAKKEFKTNDYKKAIIALKDGYKINLPWQNSAADVEVNK